MKKTYIKPEIIIENFTLSSQIASCSDIIRFSEDSCKNNVIEGGPTSNWMDEKVNLFTTEGQCTTDYYEIPNVGEKDCYHNLMAPFNS